MSKVNFQKIDDWFHNFCGVMALSGVDVGREWLVYCRDKRDTPTNRQQPGFHFWVQSTVDEMGQPMPEANNHLVWSGLWQRYWTLSENNPPWSLDADFITRLIERNKRAAESALAKHPIPKVRRAAYNEYQRSFKDNS